MEVILKDFNEEQLAAVQSEAKYLQISAGPGTGKTSTLAARILYMQLERDIEADHILGISFSRSAKQNLINKLNSYIAKVGFGSTIRIYTFHSLAHRIVRYGVFAGESKFRTGFGTESTIQLFRRRSDLFKGLCPQYTNRDQIAEAMAKAYNLIRQGNHLQPRACTHWKEIDEKKEFKIELDAGSRILIKGQDLIELWSRVDKVERINNQTDFQGLITEATRLLSLKSHTYEAVRNEWEHIFVDEYQDTSLAQEALLFLLAEDEKELTVVGDRYQTIYTFNGSNAENLDRFYSRFMGISPDETEQIFLKMNYRSSEQIVELSNQFIGEERITYQSNITGNPYPSLINTPTITLAASYVCQKIKELVECEGVQYKDICILYRKNSEYSPQASEVIEQLNQNGIPYCEERAVQDTLNLKDEIMKIIDTSWGFSIEEIKNRAIENGNENVVHFIVQAIEQGAQDLDDLIDFMVELDEPEDQIEDNYVTIKSVHSAKGMEFPVVFILYLGDKQFPHGSRPDIEEEKRLLYVGITRAMKRLYILGQHGVHAEDFLGKCRGAYTTYETYLGDSNDDNYPGFVEEDYRLIQQTGERQKEEDLKQHQRLVQMMEDW